MIAMKQQKLDNEAKYTNNPNDDVMSPDDSSIENAQAKMSSSSEFGKVLDQNQVQLDNPQVQAQIDKKLDE